VDGEDDRVRLEDGHHEIYIYICTYICIYICIYIDINGSRGSTSWTEKTTGSVSSMATLGFRV